MVKAKRLSLHLLLSLWRQSRWLRYYDPEYFEVNFNFRELWLVIKDFESLRKIGEKLEKLVVLSQISEGDIRDTGFPERRGE